MKGSELDGLNFRPDSQASCENSSERNSYSNSSDVSETCSFDNLKKPRRRN